MCEHVNGKKKHSKWFGNFFGKLGKKFPTNIQTSNEPEKFEMFDHFQCNFKLNLVIKNKQSSKAKKQVINKF